MSNKKNKKKNAKIQRENLALQPGNEIGIFIDATSHNEQNVRPQKRRLDVIEPTRKKSKLTIIEAGSHNEQNVHMSEEEKNPVEKFDITPMSNMLDVVEDNVRAGKFGKAHDAIKSSVIKDFMDHYKSMKSEDEMFKQVNGMVRKFIAICKSFYEYDDNHRKVIPDDFYDGVISSFLAIEGNSEPTGIIPKGSKKLQKVSINYDTLHNNMDKAYTINVGGILPAGVKESDTVESFLRRAYDALGMSVISDLTIELSPKIDGVSVNGTIVKDMLTNPQTRGDASESVSILGLNGLEVNSGNEPAENEFGIQYELFVTKEDVEKASKILGMETPYVSPRHAASGIMHRLCTEENAELLSCISMYPIATEGLPGTYTERMKRIADFGIVPEDMRPRKIITGNLRELLKEIDTEYWILNAIRNELSYAVDGLIITIVDDEYQKTIGRVERTNKYQIALKFEPENSQAIVDHIDLDCGQKGYRTIQVALREPIYLDGVKYDHVPVLSVPIYQSMGLRKGSIIRVHRVGDVIPAITVENVGAGDKLDLPTTCPECGNPLSLVNKKLYCANTACAGNLIGKFTHFFEAMGLDGYSDSFSEVLVNTMGCTTIGDVVSLTDKDFAKKNVTLALAKEFPKKISKALESHRDYEILGGLGLPGVGNAKAKTILTQCKFEDLADQSNEMYHALAVAAVGPNPDNLIDVMNSKEFKETVKAIEKFNYIVTEDFSKITRVGHTGGDLSKEMVELCRARGFEVVDGKAFDILITSSMSSNSGKMQAAKNKNLPIFLESDFIKQYAEEAAIEVLASSANTQRLIADMSPSQIALEALADVIDHGKICRRVEAKQVAQSAS